VYRKDRNFLRTNKKDGGGVIIAVTKAYNCLRDPNWETQDENLFITLNLISCNNRTNTSKFNLYLGVVYIPPSSQLDVYDSFFNRISGEYDKIGQNDHLCILGDFNVPGLKWEVRDGDAEIDSIQGHSAALLAGTMASLNLGQKNIVFNDHASLLDLVFSDLNCRVMHCDFPLVPEDGYHPALVVDVPAKPSKSMFFNNVPKYNYKKADFNQINARLQSVEWDTLLATENLEEAVEKFYDAFLSTIDLYTPKIKIRGSKYPIWYTESTIGILRVKNKYWKLWKRFGNKHDYEVFSNYRYQLKMSQINDHRGYLRHIEKSIKKNVKPFFSYVNGLRSTNGYPNQMFYNGTQSSDPLAITNLFCSFFESVFVSPSGDGGSACGESSSARGQTLSGFKVLSSEIYAKLIGLDVNKGAGPDMLSPLILKKCAPHITKPLTILFNWSLGNGHFPSIWKRAHITPIHKSGDKADVRNYRPVSILSPVSRIFEDIVKDHLLCFMRPIILSEQHGFVRNRSTSTNLLEYSNFLFRAMDDRVQVDSVYTDFKKAFDRVDHDLLIQKLGV
jgi:hypothetical protein